MRNILKFIVCTIVLSASPVAAQDFDAGLEAYNAGDYQTALEQWRLLAEQGDAPAQFNLGVMYARGEGVPEDDAEAARWYRLAAEQGFVDAQYNLGYMYERGEGVPEDDAEAARWYRLAAEQGDAPAQTNLGYAYAHGEGVPQNYLSAHMWYNIAGANGHELGRTNRDKIKAEMTPADVSEAQRRARVCMESNYQDCD